MPGNGQGLPEEIGAKMETKDLTFDGVKALFPEMASGPLVGAMIESGNPGVRLVSNDDDLLNMLKIIYVEDYEMARNFAEALAECDEFLYNADGKPNKEVQQRIGWLKNELSIFCSVKGRFADAYKQAATGVLTNAMSESGWKLLGMPIGRPANEGKDHNNQPGKRP
jgi:hypothetical protein